jgi:hypothetical protein
MAYKKQTWVDDETVGTADRFNHMEDGIEEAGKTGGVSTGAVIGWTGEEIPEGYEEVDSSLIPSSSGVEVGTIVHINKKKPTPDGWKDLEGKNIIVAYPINGQKVTTAAQSTVMKLEAEYFQKGTGFSIKNGEIVVGEGINNIKISGNIRINDIAAGDVVFGRLYVDSDIFDNIRVVNSTAVNGNRHTFAFSEFVLKVAKGDRIGIALQNNTSGRGSVYSDEYCSYIKVESIDDTKLIEKASVTPIEGKTGHIYDTTNVDNKNENTYSANTIDGLISEEINEKITSFHNTNKLYMGCDYLGQKKSDFNLNNLNAGECCYYFTSAGSPVNAPSTKAGVNYMIYCFYNVTTYGSIQIAFPDGSAENVICIRYRWGSAWTGWLKIAYTS